jgi:hypothetical protein
MFRLGWNIAKITGSGGTKSTCSSQVPLCGFSQVAGIQQVCRLIGLTSLHLTSLWYDL